MVESFVAKSPKIPLKMGGELKTAVKSLEIRLKSTHELKTAAKLQRTPNSKLNIFLQFSIGHPITTGETLMTLSEDASYIPYWTILRGELGFLMLIGTSRFASSFEREDFNGGVIYTVQ